MQHWPLLIPKILDHAATIYPHLQILGADAGGGLERSDWSTLCGRTMHVARALEAPDWPASKRSSISAIRI